VSCFHVTDDNMHTHTEVYGPEVTKEALFAMKDAPTAFPVFGEKMQRNTAAFRIPSITCVVAYALNVKSIKGGKPNSAIVVEPDGSVHLVVLGPVRAGDPIIFTNESDVALLNEASYLKKKADDSDSASASIFASAFASCKYLYSILIQLKQVVCTGLGLAHQRVDSNEPYTSSNSRSASASSSTSVSAFTTASCKYLYFISHYDFDPIELSCMYRWRCSYFRRWYTDLSGGMVRNSKFEIDPCCFHRAYNS